MSDHLPDRARSVLVGVTAGLLVLAGMFPPFGATDDRVRSIIRDEGYTEVLWTVDPRDWHPDTTADQVVDRVLAGLEADAVVLLHDWTDPRVSTVPDASNTIEALPPLLEAAAEQGFCFGTLDAEGQIVDAAPPTIGSRG